MDLHEVPDHFWIISSFVLLAILALITIVVIRTLQGKARIRTKWAEITGASDNAQVVAAQNTDPNIASRIQCMLDRLPLIRESKWSSFLSLLKRKGIEALNFVNNEDAQYYYECLGNIVWSGNGIKSYMSIIQKALLDQHFARFDSEVEFESYIDDVMMRLRENENRYLDQRYLTTVTTAEGTYRKRIVDRDELYKLTEQQKDETRKFVRDIFVHAREAGCV